MADEGGEQLELQWSQGDLGAVERHGSLREIDRQAIVGVALLLFLARTGPSQERLDPRDELLPPERLHHVVVRAGLQTANPLELVAARREHHDRHLAEVPDALERLPTVQIRHRDVEHDEVGRRSMEGAEACATILGLLHSEPGSVEQLGDEAPDVRVVVYHKDAGLVHTVLILNASRVPYSSGRE